MLYSNIFCQNILDEVVFASSFSFSSLKIISTYNLLNCALYMIKQCTLPSNYIFQVSNFWIIDRLLTHFFPKSLLNLNPKRIIAIAKKRCVISMPTTNIADTDMFFFDLWLWTFCWINAPWGKRNRQPSLHSATTHAIFRCVCLYYN